MRLTSQCRILFHLTLTSTVNVEKKAKKASAGTKTKKAPVAPTHPPTQQMVDASIKNLKERGGSSLLAIKKYISATYKCDAQKLAPFIKKYIKGAVASGKLIQTKGKGASGSFKLSASAIKEPKAKAKEKAGKTVEKKGKKISGTPKKVAGKKPAKKAITTAGKKRAEKKTTQKAKVKSVKKAGTVKTKNAKSKVAAPKPKTPKPRSTAGKAKKNSSA
jgi:histone H1/5